MAANSCRRDSAQALGSLLSLAHGLLTVPLGATEGLPEVSGDLRSDQRAGQETSPQRDRKFVPQGFRPDAGVAEDVTEYAEDESRRNSFAVRNADWAE